MRRRLTAKENEARRIRAVRALEQGLTKSQVAAKFGTTFASVSNWAMRFRIGGFDELRARRLGRPPRSAVPLKGFDSVQLSVLTRHPDELGLAGFLWNWRTIQALAFRSCQAEVSRWTVARYLQDWGLRPPSSLVELAASFGPAFSSNWLSELKSRARSLRSSLYFVALTEHEGESTSRTSRRSRRVVLWAFGRRGEAAFAAYPAPLRPAHIVDFLERIQLGSNTQVFAVVADPQFTAPEIRDWAERQERPIHLHLVNFVMSANRGITRAKEYAHESQS